MKIQKFNESSGEIWTAAKLIDFDKLKSSVEKRNESLKSLLERYLVLNPDLLEEYDNDVIIVTEWYFNIVNPGYKFGINYYYEGVDYSDEVRDCSLNKEQYEDLLEFFKNPDLYENTKKYNL